MRIMYNNLIDGSVTLIPSSENPNYLVENLIDPRLSRYWKTDGVVSNNSVVVDAGVGNTIKADSCSLSGHNLTSIATIKIQANSGDTWDSPVLDETMTWNDQTITKFFTSTDVRYWRYLIGDSENPDGAIKIGRPYLSESLQITKACSNSLTETIIDTTEGFYSGGGQYYGTKGYKVRRYELIFPYWTNSMKEEIKTMVRAVGNTKPVILIIDENNMDKVYPVYAVITGNYPFTNIYNYQWNGMLTFQEVL